MIYNTTTIHQISQADTRYPDTLRPYKDAPKELYARGNLALLHDPYFRIALVGTRKLTTYGEAVVRGVLPTLACKNVVSVSGLAFGADALVHEHSLKNNIPTIAVLAGGVDQRTVSPRSNAPLGERILEQGGLLISEWPPGTTSFKHHFPLRNRIVAGLSTATVVIEAPMKSGALITAYVALEYGRDVFAVPGPITYENCMGTNALIARGAIPLCNPSIVKDYYQLPSRPIRDTNLTEDDKVLLSVIKKSNGTIDNILELSHLTTPQTLQKLTTLSLKNMLISSGDTYTIIDNPT